jgi:hypothetical protein
VCVAIRVDLIGSESELGPSGGTGRTKRILGGSEADSAFSSCSEPDGRRGELMDCSDEAFGFAFFFRRNLSARGFGFWLAPVFLEGIGTPLALLSLSRSFQRLAHIGGLGETMRRSEEELSVAGGS